MRFFVLAIFLCTVPVQADTSTLKSQRIRFDLLPTKHMVVNIKINGKGPFRVIFDTGSPVNLINRKTAKAAGLVDKEPASGLLSLFGPPQQPKAKKLEVGEVVATDIPMMVMDHPTVDLAASVFGPIEGILGFPFFARYNTTLDYQTKTMTLRPGTFKPVDTIESLLALLTNWNKAQKRTLSPGAVLGFTLDANKVNQPGVLIKSVVPESPAALSGMLAGDRLLTLDDRWTDSVEDCYIAAGYLQPGVGTTMKVHREGKELVLPVTPKTGF